MRAITFLFVGQSSSRPLEKIGEDIRTSSEVIGVHMLNFWPKFYIFAISFRGGGVPVGVCANKPWSIYSACKNLRGHYPLRAEI